jgi:hypothetical protein
LGKKIQFDWQTRLADRIYSPSRGVDIFHPLPQIGINAKLDADHHSLFFQFANAK